MLLSIMYDSKCSFIPDTQTPTLWIRTTNRFEYIHFNLGRFQVACDTTYNFHCESSSMNSIENIQHRSKRSLTRHTQHFIATLHQRTGTDADLTLGIGISGSIVVRCVIGVTGIRHGCGWRA